MYELGVLWLVIILFAIVLAILWICLPFAVFGTKPKIDELIAEMKANNALLQEISAQLARRGFDG